MSKVEWVRPSGSTIETADTPELEEYALSNGWKKAPSDDKPKPRGRPSKQAS